MKGPKYIIYGLIDPRNGELRYVGKSSQGLTRPQSHACPSNLTERTHKGHWVKSLADLGLKPDILVLEVKPDANSLNEAECFHIAYFRQLGCNLTNATTGGEGAPGNRASETARAKMSASKLGRPKSPEHKAAIAKALQGHSFSEETRKKIGESHKGNNHCRGRKLSEISRAKMSISVSRTCAKGHKLSDETRAKMSEAAKAREAKRRRNKELAC